MAMGAPGGGEERGRGGEGGAVQVKIWHASSTALRSSREAACLPNEMDLTPPQCEQRPAAAAKKQAGKKRQREPSPDSSDEAEVAEAEEAAVVAQLLAELGAAGMPSAAAAGATGGAAASGRRRPQRPGAGSGLSAIIADLALDDDGAEGAPTRRLPARQTALSSPSGSRRRLQQAARAFEEWAQPDEAAVALAAGISEDEGTGCRAMVDCQLCIQWSQADALPCLRGSSLHWRDQRTPGQQASRHICPSHSHHVQWTPSLPGALATPPSSRPSMRRTATASAASPGAQRQWWCCTGMHA